MAALCVEQERTKVALDYTRLLVVKSDPDSETRVVSPGTGVGSLNDPGGTALSSLAEDKGLLLDTASEHPLTQP